MTSASKPSGRHQVIAFLVVAALFIGAVSVVFGDHGTPDNVLEDRLRQNLVTFLKENNIDFSYRTYFPANGSAPMRWSELIIDSSKDGVIDFVGSERYPTYENGKASAWVRIPKIILIPQVDTLIVRYTELCDPKVVLNEQFRGISFSVAGTSCAPIFTKLERAANLWEVRVEKSRQTLRTGPSSSIERRK